MKIWTLLVFLLILPVAQATLVEQSVHVQLTQTNLVEERIILVLASEQEYTGLEYTLGSEPLSVVTDHTYHLEQSGEETIFVIDDPIPSGESRISFTLLSDSIIEISGKNRIFSQKYELVEPALFSLTVRLPKGSTLVDREPAVSPRPDSITTDGRTIILHWDAQQRDRFDLIVLYERNVLPFFLPAIVIILFVALVIFLGYHIKSRRAKRGVLHDTLGEDEITVLNYLQQGFNTQKILCEKTEFSKSKMSKVIRKLEQKKAVHKQPFFKTNKITLNKEWK